MTQGAEKVTKNVRDFADPYELRIIREQNLHHGGAAAAGAHDVNNLWPGLRVVLSVMSQRFRSSNAR